MKKWIFIIFISFLIFSSFSGAVFGKENSPTGGLEINFFYGKTCPYCADEQKFLDEAEVKYPEVTINRYISSDPDNRKLLIDLCKKHNVEKYVGLVPLTFIGKDFFLGFDDLVGKKIEESIQRQLKDLNHREEGKKIHLPLIGEIDLAKYSLPAQAVVLGFFDGFNVCSLGALILILGLVLVLRSRSKILTFGGIFILTTAIIYGLLIVLWYQLFHFLAPYLKAMGILVGLLGIGGGIYFSREFIRFRKYGPTCDTEKRGVISRFFSKIQSHFKKPRNLLAVIISIFIFAIVITVVEFPCSAVIPVLFASALAEAHLSALTYLLYIAVFIFFYIIDEIIVFLIALFTMTVKIASSKTITWITLIEAIILFGLGFYYLFGIF